VFNSLDAWRTELEALADAIPQIEQFKGRLSEGPEVARTALETAHGLNARMQKAFVYAGLLHEVDTGDEQATGMFNRASALNARVLAAMSFINPELLQIGKAKLDAWMAQNSELRVYAHAFDDLFRKQAHIRSAEVEEVLGMLADPFGGPGAAEGVLANADMSFAPAVDSAGQSHPLSQGTYLRLLQSGDSNLRRTAWENYTQRYLEFKNTFATLLSSSIKQNVFQMRARRFDSTLEMALDEQNIPVPVFLNLLETFQSHIPLWHRYWSLRRRALGVEELQPYDVWAPLAKEFAHVPYQQAVEWICAGLAPMGAEYVEIVRRGCSEERWVDVYPTRGKRQGAFSWGAQGTYPFIVMNYVDAVQSLSTLAHELGHSMHSYYTWKSQPPVYAGYGIFPAEVASNFHQALVRDYLLNTVTDRALKINILEEAMFNFHRYFFVMPTLARFELETHRRVERGEPLTAESMIELCADLFTEAFGPQVQIDRPRVGIVWATFGHLFADYYVFQYATGISGAHALAKRVLNGGPGTAEDYVSFLKAGSSKYALDALRDAGVDLARPEPVQAAFEVLESYINQLEQLL
jgi:oligoendopeptidase F